MKKHIQENRMTLTKIAARLTMLLNLDKFRYQAASMVEISILLICFCSFELFSHLLEKDNFIENVYIALSCHNK